MSRTLKLLLAVPSVALSMALPFAAQAQEGGRAADLRYCAKLSDLYIRYVGRSEAGPNAPVRPDVNGGVALAKCQEGDTASGDPHPRAQARQCRSSPCRRGADLAAQVVRRQGFQRRKLAIRRRPVAWLFSGWNCVPARLSRPTTAVIGPP